MAWNSDFTRFKSSDLAGIDCGSGIRIPRRDRLVTKTAVYTGDLEKGQCVAMVRVPKGARMMAVDLNWRNGSTTAPILAVGDPYACARFLGPVAVLASVGRGELLSQAAAALAGGVACLPWGLCGTMTKTGNSGDGCGVFYQYTCETDICVINLDHVGQAAQGGFHTGALTVLSPLGAKYTGGQLVLTVSYLDAS